MNDISGMARPTEMVLYFLESRELACFNETLIFVVALTVRPLRVIKVWKGLLPFPIYKKEDINFSTNSCFNSSINFSSKLNFSRNFSITG